jgi:hypothetical protein
MTSTTPLALEDIVTATYCAMDDALAHAGIPCELGKLVPRSGPPPQVDDREVLCLAVLQELLGYESDHAFHCWLHGHPVMRRLFPRLLSRQNFADRRALLTPLLACLTQAFCSMHEAPPFSSSIRTRSMSAAPSAQGKSAVSRAWRDTAIAPR